MQILIGTWFRCQFGAWG